MIAKAALLLLLLAADAPAGRYRLSGAPDVASELVLLPDGRFRYFLAAGALDEHSQGRWTSDGKIVRLTTQPKPMPPVFTAAPAAATSEAPLTLKVTWPDGRGIAGVDVRIGFDSGEPTEGYTQEYGWSLPAGETRAPRWVELAVPMHALASPRFPINPSKGNALTFVLTPNDLGLVVFQDQPLETAGPDLILHRGAATLVYKPIGD